MYAAEGQEVLAVVLDTGLPDWFVFTALPFLVALVWYLKKYKGF